MSAKRWWVRWFSAGDFEYHGPWWESGVHCLADRDQGILVAAVLAPSEEAAKRVIQDAHDNKNVDIEWSFVNERADDWEPFCDRFPAADWMQWPRRTPHKEPTR